jgi:NRPS condensation-like uncharacterized protein
VGYALAVSSAGDESATLQSRLEVAHAHGPDGDPPADAAPPPVADPVALLHHLDVSGRFHRDSRMGRVFHAGKVSLRENVSTDSLHVVVEGDRVKAHVDGVSPLATRSQGLSGYSLRRAVVHNLAGMAQDLVWLVRGRLGDHLCELDCEWVASDAHRTPHEGELLDPKASAWSVQMEARVAGRLDEARLRAALGLALGRDAFERDPLEVVDCDDDDALDAARGRLQSMAVPVSANPPLHAHLARHRDGDVLMLNVNHAAADAFGALHVLHAIARAYAGDADGGAPLDFLALRDLPVRPASTSASRALRACKKADERLRNMLAPPACLAADQPGDHPGYGFHLVSLSEEQTRLAVDATRPGTSRNVLMAALHLAIDDWNLQHGGASGRRIGVLVPANLRPREWRQERVGNFSVTARISTSHRDRADPSSALKAITIQTTRNKRNRTGVALIAALQRTGMLELWVKQSVVVLKPAVHNRDVDTAMLCNVGFVDETLSFGPDAGDAVGLSLSIPARSPLNLCIGAVTMAGRLHLTFRYPHSLFGPDAARRFADGYLDQIRLVAAASR